MDTSSRRHEASLTAFVFAFFILNLCASEAWSADPSLPGCTLQLRIEGAIGPAQVDYFDRAMIEAKARGCQSVLLNINTPGGSLASTRLMVEKILASPIPILCLVGPEGGHAASAGALLLLSCHVNGAEPATNLGAATPIGAGGADIAKDLRAKVVEDTAGWAQALAKQRGRSETSASMIVTDAKSYTAENAAQMGFIDVVAPDRAHFLSFAEGREVLMSGSEKKVVAVGAVMAFEEDLRVKFLKIATNPEFAYLLFMMSLGLLYFEITHPGSTAPGIAGGIGLVVSLLAFHALEVSWAGALLIAIGLGCLIAEAFVPAMGAFGTGGIVSFAFGSILLFEPGTVSLALLLATPLALGTALFALAIFVFRTRRMAKIDPTKSLLGLLGRVASLESPSKRRGMIVVQGEYWHFVSKDDLDVESAARVIAQEGLTLEVKRDFSK